MCWMRSQKSPLCSKGTPISSPAYEESRSEKSAEAVLVDASRRRAERGEVESGMTIRRAQRQMSTQVERVGKEQGEALPVPASDEAQRPRHEAEDTGAGLLKAVLARDNMQQAWKRVRSNKGAEGIDGLSIDETAEHDVSHRSAHVLELKPDPSIQFQQPEVITKLVRNGNRPITRPPS
jgi:hypothetical protein